MSAAEGCSEDTLFDGHLICRQPRKGYRFSIDAVLLAHFFSPKPGEWVLDLGAGCGVVSLVGAYRHPQVHFAALELQPHLVDCIRENIQKNNFIGRIEVVEGDCKEIAKLATPGSFDWVVSNPPYRKISSGRHNPVSGEAIARHEIAVDLAGVVQAARTAVKTRGRVAFVYPAARLAALLAELKTGSLEPKRLQVVHSYPGSPGRMVLVEAVRMGGEELEILPPLYIYEEKNGEYSQEVAGFFAV